MRKIDPKLLTLSSVDGMIAVSNRLQGRIFCELDGELIHRFNAGLAADPSPDRFNNLGGNSLWPGPEGGEFAFNYLPDTGWLVQDAINRQETVTVADTPEMAVVAKNITLMNRKGVEVPLIFRRSLWPMTTPAYGLKSISYCTIDKLQAVNPQRLVKALFGAWSLEQFPGGDGVIAFGRFAGDAKGAINTDFYGDPGSRLQYYGNVFRLELGGKERFQIGIAHMARPELIGAFDRQRGLLMIRCQLNRDNSGIYFNIADNDQPHGPYSAADCYSIFNGGELGFFELETIAPLELDAAGRGLCSRLESKTVILKGTPEQLAVCLERHWQISPSIIEV